MELKDPLICLPELLTPLLYKQLSMYVPNLCCYTTYMYISTTPSCPIHSVKIRW